MEGDTVLPTIIPCSLVLQIKVLPTSIISADVLENFLWCPGISLNYIYQLSLIIIMDLSNRVVQVRSTLKPDVMEYPSFKPDDISLFFGDLATPAGLVLNHGNPRECFVILPDSEYAPDIIQVG